jgi:hypothetical protein
MGQEDVGVEQQHHWEEREEEPARTAPQVERLRQTWIAMATSADGSSVLAKRREQHVWTRGTPHHLLAYSNFPRTGIVLRFELNNATLNWAAETVQRFHGR